MTTTSSSIAMKSAFEKTHVLDLESTKHFDEPHLTESFPSPKIKDKNTTGSQFQAFKSQKHALHSTVNPSDYCKQEPTYLHDRGLTCLLSQLGRINDQIQYNDSLKKVLADYEEENKRALAASMTKSSVSSCSKSNGEINGPKVSNWKKYYDNEVGAEYFFNHQTGEASWLDPDAA